MLSDTNGTYVLGLDLGANSIGWAMLGQDKGGPTSVIATGVRIFEAGVEGDIEQGRDESRAVARRQARAIRRQVERRTRRHLRLAHILQEVGLLPEGKLDAPQDRHVFFTSLDAKLRKRYKDDGAPQTLAHLFPYWLRARALDQTLKTDELGRAIYHLSQRRGFLSNRKAAAKEEEDKETGAVKEGIKKLEHLMEEAGSRTLGEYLSTLDPEQERVRGRWTARQMYIDEFNAIWEAQKGHHGKLLTDEAYKAIFESIFHQRPLKIQRHLIGRCQLEFGRVRAPIALLAAQRFRVLQKVNDLRIVCADFEERCLNAEQRALLLDKLDRHEEVKFTDGRRLLGVKGTTFNLERGGEEKLKGNRTAAKLRRIFGERWDTFTDEERDRIVEDGYSFEKEEPLACKARKLYGLDAEDARKLATLSLEPGYLSLSRQALAKLLPLMEGGMAYMAAKKQVYGMGEGQPAVSILPYVDEAINQQLMPQLRNPAVHRVLTELYRVVNNIIDRYGKPALIRIEMARDLKRPREQRKQIWQRNRRNEKTRDSARSKVAGLIGKPDPSHEDILRYQLAEECNWECPYTGIHISESALFSDQSRFDIEHIIPFSRSLDNSFVNKTLCYHEENRRVKRNKTPFEAYGSDPERWDTILKRVAAFKGESRDAKLRRFKMENMDEFDDFVARQLNDTRYASTLAAQYLNLLYGGEYRKHIQVTSGQITAYLRGEWRMNGILGDGGIKSRDDHRHHAVDAIAIALTSPATVKQLSQAAERAPAGVHRRFKNMPVPWESFGDDVRKAIEQIVVSHKVSRKVNGRLHEDTFYSPPKTSDEGKPCVHVRKRIDALSTNEVAAIVDPAVRERVHDKLDDLGIADPKKAFADRKNHPFIETKDGRRIPIHKARIRRNASPFSVGKGPRERHVTTDSNHHMEIVEVTDKKGNAKWEDIIVSQYEALCRQRRGESVVQRDHGPEKRFVCSLAVGDTVEMDDEKGARHLYKVRTVSKDYLAFTLLSDARIQKEIAQAKDWVAIRLNGARRRVCQKMTVTPLGEVRRAND